MRTHHVSTEMKVGNEFQQSYCFILIIKYQQVCLEFGFSREMLADGEYLPVALCSRCCGPAILQCTGESRIEWQI